MLLPNLVRLTHFPTFNDAENNRLNDAENNRLNDAENNRLNDAENNRLSLRHAACVCHV